MTDLADKIERLSAAATPGEWATSPDHVSDQDYETCIELTDRVGHIGAAIAYFHHDWETDRISWKAARSNTALCVTLHNAVPELLSALRAQQHAEALAEALAEVTDKLWVLRCNSHDELDRKCAEKAVDMGTFALAAYRSVK